MKKDLKHAFRVMGEGTDVRIALLLGLIAAVSVAVFQVPFLHPNIWRESAVAAFLRPADTFYPGIWRWIATGVFAAMGIDVGMVALRILGCVYVGVLTGFFYLMDHEILGWSARSNTDHAWRRLTILRVSCAVGSLALAYSCATWSAANAGGSDLFLMMFACIIIFYFVRFMRTGSVRLGEVCAFLAGILCAETPYGLVLVIVGGFLYWQMQRRVVTAGFFSQKADLGDRVGVVTWCLTFLVLFGYLVGMALIVGGYTYHQGLIGDGFSAATVMQILQGYAVQVTGAATTDGWLAIVGLVVIPSILTYSFLPKAVGEEDALSYKAGLLFFVSAAVVMSQLSMVRSLWMDSWGDSPNVTSPQLAIILTCLAAGVIVRALMVFGVYLLCRNYQRVTEISLDAADDDDDPNEERRLKVRTWIFAFICIGLLAAIAPGRVRSGVRAQMRFLAEYVEAVLDDAQGCKFLFTDGRFDDILRLKTAARGGDLKMIAFMNDGSEKVARQLRNQCVETDEDHLSADLAANVLLRSWVHKRGEKLAESAAQIGFEIWKRDLQPMPPCWGTLARTQGDAAKRAASIARGRDMADRILAFCCEYTTARQEDFAVQDRFNVLQWRLARIAAIRSENFDLAGDAKTAEAESKRYDELDRNNSSLIRLFELMAKVHASNMRAMTPREALQMALRRADFRTARFYAERIVSAEPSDIEANFAMAMSYANNGQYGRAQIYFERCVAVDPTDTVCLNNLAMTHLALGEYDEAESNALKAVSLAPKSKSLLNTLKQVRDAKAIAATNGIPPKVEAPAATGGPAPEKPAGMREKKPRL